MITMCNLGEGLAEEREAIGFAKGEASGKEKTMISVVLQMNKMHLPLDQMMTISGKSEQEIKEIIDKYSKDN